MSDNKDIADLLEEVQTIVHVLRDEKTDFYGQVKGLEGQLSLMKVEKTKNCRNYKSVLRN